MTNEKQFLERVKRETRRAPVESEGNRLGSFLRILGWVNVTLGVLASLSIMVILESAFQQFGGYETVEVVNVLSQAEGYDAMLEQLGFTNLLDFVKIYEIRWLLVLAALGFFGVLAAMFFVASRRKV